MAVKIRFVFVVTALVRLAALAWVYLTTPEHTEARGLEPPPRFGRR